MCKVTKTLPNAKLKSLLYLETKFQELEILAEVYEKLKQEKLEDNFKSKRQRIWRKNKCKL